MRKYSFINKKLLTCTFMNFFVHKPIYMRNFNIINMFMNEGKFYYVHEHIYKIFPGVNMFINMFTKLFLAWTYSWTCLQNCLWREHIHEHVQEIVSSINMFMNIFIKFLLVWIYSWTCSQNCHWHEHIHEHAYIFFNNKKSWINYRERN